MPARDGHDGAAFSIRGGLDLIGWELATATSVSPQVVRRSPRTSMVFEGKVGDRLGTSKVSMINRKFTMIYP